MDLAYPTWHAWVVQVVMPLNPQFLLLGMLFPPSFYSSLAGGFLFF